MLDMKTTPADLPGSIEDLRALIFLQAEEHEEEKQQLELKVAEQEQSIAKQEQSIAEQEQSIAKQEQEIAKQEQTVSEYSEEISQLREYIRLLKSQRFGPSSERSVAEQMGLFNEAEAAADEGTDEEPGAQAESDEPSIEVPAHTRRKRGGRRRKRSTIPSSAGRRGGLLQALRWQEFDAGLVSPSQPFATRWGEPSS
jgi:uncharacterized coiled-coil protein SlyX